MSPSFSSRQQDVRQLGKNLEAFVAHGDVVPLEFFNQVLGLPRSEVPILKDTILSMCEAQLGGKDRARIARLEDFGATLIRYLGLNFDDATINDLFVPALVSMAERRLDKPLVDVKDRMSRYERLSALAQLAPRIHNNRFDEVLEAALALARNRHGFEPDLLLPLANFERVYRNRSSEWETSDLVRGQHLCLASIRDIFELAVKAVAGDSADPDAKVVHIFPLVYTAGLALLTLLPSVAQTEDAICIEQMKQILDSSEWLLSRGEGFPGSYYSRADMQSFDRIRSVVSVASAILLMKCPEYAEVVTDMRIAKRKGSHRIGTTVLEVARRAKGSEAIEFVQGVVLAELHDDGVPHGRRLDRESMLEISALAWHLDVGDDPSVKASIDRIRDPRGQFYLTKALEGTPWE